MENVHILTQRISGRGEFLPFSAEQYNSNTATALHELAAKLQTSLVLEDILGTFANFARQLLNFSGVHFKATSIDVKTPNSDVENPAYSFDLKVENPDLWSDKVPNLYELELQLLIEGVAGVTYQARVVSCRQDQDHFYASASRGDQSNL